VPTEKQGASSRRPSSPASILSLSVLIAATTLVFHGGAVLFLLVCIVSCAVLSVLTLWGWTSIRRVETERSVRVETADTDSPVVRVQPTAQNVRRGDL
jgi:Flp pilus assembly protein TadB